MTYIPTNRDCDTTPENAAQDFARTAGPWAKPQTPITDAGMAARAAILRKRMENPDTAQAAQEALFCTFLSLEGKVVQVRDF